MKRSSSAKINQRTIDFKINILDIKAVDPECTIMNNVYMISLRRHGQTLTTKFTAPAMLETNQDDAPNFIITFNESFNLEATMFTLPDSSFREKLASLTIQHREQDSKSSKIFAVDSDIIVKLHEIFDDEMAAKNLECPFVANGVKFQLDILVEMSPSSAKSFTSRLIKTKSLRKSGDFIESTSIRSIQDLHSLHSYSSSASLISNPEGELSPMSGQSDNNLDDIMKEFEEQQLERLNQLTSQTETSEPAAVIEIVAVPSMFTPHLIMADDKLPPSNHGSVNQDDIGDAGIAHTVGPEVVVTPTVAETNEFAISSSLSHDQSLIDDSFSYSSSSKIVPDIQPTIESDNRNDGGSPSIEKEILPTESMTTTPTTDTTVKLSAKSYRNVYLLLLGYIFVILSIVVTNNEGVFLKKYGSLDNFCKITVNHATSHYLDFRLRINDAIRDARSRNRANLKKSPKQPQTTPIHTEPLKVSDSKDIDIKPDKSSQWRLQRSNAISRLGRLLNPIRLANLLWSGMVKLFNCKPVK